MVGAPEDVRRWAARWRAVEARIREEPPLARDTAIEVGLDLIDHLARVHGWPIVEDDVRRREVERARAHWRRLLTHWPAR